MPATSKMDGLLAKAETISDCGSTSMITYLRREKKLLHNSTWERGVRRCVRNSSANTKVSEEEGGGGVPGTKAEIPLQPMVKTLGKQTVPLQPMKDPAPE
ncbi:protein pxr1-like [Limosa lapponica baueri]|uniref:Protein pxr1-like n=1 Tax=Limosa lapponica baueri TaxID=1758121 RepID=A0A2I0U4C3_LIMLA|nr:protein pxr1-like [Limosa lapponica baueri]